MTDSPDSAEETTPNTGGNPDSAQPSDAPTGAPLPPPVVVAEPASQKKKVFAALAAVGVLIIGVVVVTGLFGGSSSAKRDHIFVAYDPQGSGSYYSVEMKDGKAVVGARLSSQDLGSFDVYGSFDDDESYSTNIVAIDKKTILLKQYPEGSDEDAVDFVKVDIETAQSVNLFSSREGGSGIYVASEETLFISDDKDCFKVSLEGISTRVGLGSCVVGGGRVAAVGRDGTTTSFVYLDEEGNSAAPINISISQVDRYSADRSVLWGKTENNEVVVYDTLTGKQLWRYGDDDTLVSILDSSTDGSSLLVTVDDLADSDAEVDIAVARDVDGSYEITVLASAFKAGGAIAPDGDGALVFTQGLEDASGTIQYYGSDLKAPKPVASQAVINDIGVSPQGGAVIVTDSQILTGTFSSGFEQKVNGKFSSIYDNNFFSISGSDAIVMNLVGASEDGGDNQIVYLPAPLATDGSSNAIVVASGDPNPYLFNEHSLKRSSKIVYGTKSDDYVILNERELKKDAASVRLVEGRLSTFFEAEGDELTYFESTASDRYTTYSLKGSDASKREVVAEGYYIYRIPIGDPGSTLKELSWNYYSSTAQVDDDLDECRSSGRPTIQQGGSERISLAANYTNNYEWTYFCVQNAGQGVTTYVSTSDSTGNTSGKPLWMRLNCYDKDNSNSDFFDSKEIAYEGGRGASGSYSSPSNGSYATCAIADNAYHGGYSSSYSVGGSVLVSVSSD